MKLFSILTLLFTFHTAQAQVPFYVCGLEDIQKIATLDMKNLVLTTAELSPSETKTLKRAIDHKWDCDEGVELIGSVMIVKPGSEQVYYQAFCSKDSLGTRKVKIALDCRVESYN